MLMHGAPLHTRVPSTNPIAVRDKLGRRLHALLVALGVKYGEFAKESLTIGFAYPKKVKAPEPRAEPVLKQGDDAEAFAASFFADDANMGKSIADVPLPRPADTDPNLVVVPDPTVETTETASAETGREMPALRTPQPKSTPVPGKPVGDASKSAEHLLDQIRHPSRYRNKDANDKKA